MMKGMLQRTDSFKTWFNCRHWIKHRVHRLHRLSTNIKSLPFLSPLSNDIIDFISKLPICVVFLIHLQNKSEILKV